MSDLLNREVEAQFGEIQYLEFGSDHHQKAVTGITTLVKQQFEIEKFETERLDKLAEQKKQEELEAKKVEIEDRKLQLQEKQLVVQAKQNKQSSINSLLGVLATVGIAALGIGVNIWGTKYTMKYEDEGVMPTTQAGREHTKRLFNK